MMQLYVFDFQFRLTRFFPSEAAFPDNKPVRHETWNKARFEGWEVSRSLAIRTNLWNKKHFTTIIDSPGDLASHYDSILSGASPLCFNVAQQINIIIIVVQVQCFV